MTNEIRSLRQRLQSVQDEITPVNKDSVNPHFKSKFADINSILEMLRPILRKHGVTVLQPLTNMENGKPAIRTIVTCETGEMIEGTLPIPENADPQKLGGWITYMRRYSLQSFFVLGAEDLDAEEILRPVVKTPTAAPRDWKKGRS